jgi:hypothetical protein
MNYLKQRLNGHGGIIALNPEFRPAIFTHESYVVILPLGWDDLFS